MTEKTRRRLLVGVTGIAGSGKDTAAQTLVEYHGFVRDAFADDMKKAALALDPWIVDTIATNGEHPEHPEHRRLSRIVERDGWEQAKKNPEVRTFLQRLGTEAGWQLHGPRLWVDRVGDRLAANPEQDTVVTDVRFPEEVDWLHENGGVLVRIVRPEHSGAAEGTRGHSSETALAGVEPEFVLINDSSIARLHQNMDRVVQMLRGLLSLSELGETVYL